jgi:C2 domain
LYFKIKMQYSSPMHRTSYMSPLNNQGQVIEEKTRTTTTEEFIPAAGYQGIEARSSYIPARTSYVGGRSSYLGGATQRLSYTPETRTSYVPVTTQKTSYVPVTTYETKYVPQTTTLLRQSYVQPLQTSQYIQPLQTTRHLQSSQFMQQGSNYQTGYGAPLAVGSGLHGLGHSSYYGQQNTQYGQQGLCGSQCGMQNMQGSQYGQQGGSLMGRTLMIRPVAAQLTHRTDFILFKMDPFVEIAIGPNRYKTTVHKNGGKRPQWNETFTHELYGNEGDMSVIVWDQDRRKVDLVGETKINLGQVLANGSSSNWYELFWRGKTAGRILINLEVL